jgi:hypothetical protein
MSDHKLSSKFEPAVLTETLGNIAVPTGGSKVRTSNMTHFVPAAHLGKSLCGTKGIEAPYLTVTTSISICEKAILATDDP